MSAEQINEKVMDYLKTESGKTGDSTFKKVAAGFVSSGSSVLLSLAWLLIAAIISIVVVELLKIFLGTTGFYNSFLKDAFFLYLALLVTGIPTIVYLNYKWTKKLEGHAMQLASYVIKGAK